MPVYFIRSGDTGPVKIGWADDVEKRRRMLQTAHPYPLQVVRIIGCRRGTERWLQKRYEAAKLLGEWFAFSPEMLTVEPPDLEVAPRPQKGRGVPGDALAECLQFCGAPPEIIAEYTRDLRAIIRRQEAAE